MKENKYTHKAYDIFEKKDEDGVVSYSLVTVKFNPQTKEAIVSSVDDKYADSLAVAKYKMTEKLVRRLMGLDK